MPFNVNKTIEKLLDDIYSDKDTMAAIEYFTFDWVRVDVLKKHLKKLLKEKHKIINNRKLTPLNKSNSAAGEYYRKANNQK
jgi:hypothetical protein